MEHAYYINDGPILKGEASPCKLAKKNGPHNSHMENVSRIHPRLQLHSRFEQRSQRKIVYQGFVLVNHFFRRYISDCVVCAANLQGDATNMMSRSSKVFLPYCNVGIF